MKIPCAMIRDLLPLYAEKMVEPETESLVKEHLEECAECRNKLAGMEAETGTTVDTAKPLQTLKKEIRKRRWIAAAIAALCVFIAVFTWFYHANEWKLVPWEEGLIEVAGTEERPYEEVFEPGNDPAESRPSTVEVLIVKVDSRINGTNESVFRDDDGTETVLLEGWTTNGSGNFVRDYHEMTFCPVPDRLIYDDGSSQKLVWGKPLNGGVATLPRLTLGYYVILAFIVAAVSGIAWFILRKNDKSWIARQVFFAPVSYLGAHFLIKGVHTVSDFLGHDFLSILVIAVALYALLSLAWQVFLQKKKEH